MKPWIDYSPEDDQLLYDQEFDLEAELAMAFVEESLHCPAPVNASPSLECRDGEASSAHKTAGETSQVQELQRELLAIKAALQREVTKNETLEQELRLQKNLTDKEKKRLKEATVLLENQEKYIYKQVATVRDLGHKLEEQVHNNEKLQKSLEAQKQKTKDLTLQLHQANELVQKKEDDLVKKILSNKSQGDKLMNLEEKNKTLEEQLKVQQKKTHDKSTMLDQLMEQAQKNELVIEKKVREVTVLQRSIRTLEDDKEALKQQLQRGQRNQMQTGYSSRRTLDLPEEERNTSRNSRLRERASTWRDEPPPNGRLSGR